MNWKLIGDAVRARREELAMSQHDAAEAAGVSVPTWGVIENARQDGYKPRTVMRVCRALKWQADAFERIDQGLEPVEAASTRSVVSVPVAIAADINLDERSKVLLLSAYEGLLRHMGEQS